MGKRFRETLLQGGHREGPETYERMLSITGHQRDENLNHNEIPFHTVENDHHKQSNEQQVLERMWRKQNPSTLLVGLQTGATIMEDSMEFPLRTKNGTTF